VESIPGGGALLDLGVYPISFASFVLGAPTTVIGTGITAASGVDAQASLILDSSNNAQALLNLPCCLRRPRWPRFPLDSDTSALTAHS
jgi:predicted dehydrogenase